MEQSRSGFYFIFLHVLCLQEQFSAAGAQMGIPGTAAAESTGRRVEPALSAQAVGRLPRGDTAGPWVGAGAEGFGGRRSVARYRSTSRASVADVLGAVADRFSLETAFRDVKEVVGAGQQQVRFIGANIGAFHLCLWTHTMTEAWAWNRADD